ncbi:MAG: dTDP-4-dehydrorhamnose 3,5-epimerase [Actinobacteria bacterium]|nr:dTDP-4-dehydrorhamnose 3,5-epimerase [Actinomycetota bacterium]
MPFSATPLEIPEVLLIEPKVFIDDRGFFMESYSKRDFEDLGLPQEFIQDNHSKSAKGVLRGLHYQKDPMSQGKLVRCIRGLILDVAVDIRKGSPTYGRSISVILSEENKKLLWVPRGFAHGFITLEDDTEVIYKVDNPYSPEHDRGIAWNDPVIGIDWPLDSPSLSAKDTNQPLLKEADNNFSYLK